MKISEEVAKLLNEVERGEVIVLACDESGDHYLGIQTLQDAITELVEDQGRSAIVSRTFFLKLEI